MRWRVRASCRRLRALLVWVRHFCLDASDVFLASYPRSGNTIATVAKGLPSRVQTVGREDYQRISATILSPLLESPGHIFGNSVGRRSAMRLSGRAYLCFECLSVGV